MCSTSKHTKGSLTRYTVNGMYYLHPDKDESLKAMFQKRKAVRKRRRAGNRKVVKQVALERTRNRLRSQVK